VTVGFALKPKIAARGGDSGKFNAGSGAAIKERGEKALSETTERKREEERRTESEEQRERRGAVHEGTGISTWWCKGRGGAEASPSVPMSLHVRLHTHERTTASQPKATD